MTNAAQDATPDTDSFWDSYQRHKTAIAEANTLNKEVVFDDLIAAGITQVYVSFDGDPDPLDRRAACPRRPGFHPVLRRLGQGHPARAVDGPRPTARRQS